MSISSATASNLLPSLIPSLPPCSEPAASHLLRLIPLSAELPHIAVQLRHHALLAGLAREEENCGECCFSLDTNQAVF